MKGSILAVLCLALTLAVPFLQAHAHDKRTIHFTITKEGLFTNDIKMQDKRFTATSSRNGCSRCGASSRIRHKYGSRNSHSPSVTSLGYDLRVVLIT